MKRSSYRRRLAVILLGGIPLITSLTCDPRTGVVDITRANGFLSGSHGSFSLDFLSEDECFDCFLEDLLSLDF